MTDAIATIAIAATFITAMYLRYRLSLAELEAAKKENPS